jgi:hypothetical protein
MSESPLTHIEVGGFILCSEPPAPADRSCVDPEMAWWSNCDACKIAFGKHLDDTQEGGR